MSEADLKINVNFTLSVPADSVQALEILAALEPGNRNLVRSFVQAEAELYIHTYLYDNGVETRPVRGVAFAPDDYLTGWL